MGELRQYDPYSIELGVLELKLPKKDGSGNKRLAIK